MDDLVSTQWLADRLGETDLTIVDASWFMPASGRSGRDEYGQAHIPGARFLDIDEVRDADHPAPHMIPSAEAFGAAMERLGIRRADRIVVYDNSPVRTAARGWFMLRHFGAGQDRHSRRRLPEMAGRRATDRERRAGAAIGAVRRRRARRGCRQGGHPGRASTHPCSTRAARAVSTAAKRIPDPEWRRAIYRERATCLFGALSRGRAVPLGRGAAALVRRGRDRPERPFVATCGSGVTANSLIFAAHLLGNDSTRLYDGSWSEWGADPATPKAVGAAA